jgi:lysosomal Pro-X carboxypeptidase
MRPLFISTSISIFLLFIPYSSSIISKRWKPKQNGYILPNTEPKFTIDDMDCDFMSQPLNHFQTNSPTYLQRYCIFDNFTQSSSSPILFYTGNESPIEQYINQTGLMWELAPIFGASVVFVEHRYEGMSLPNISHQCMSYSSSKQALADYAVLLDRINPQSKRPVIAFGGSYGGMLSAWMRRLYPNMVAGAIAASAPIMGFPRQAPWSIDAAYQVVSRGLSYGYPATKGLQENACFMNLLAAWPLITYLGSNAKGRQKLRDTFNLCQPLHSINDTNLLLDWAQSPWFDMAEGSYPYPSSYIPFSLHMGLHKLPAWPLQAACWKTDLHRNHGIALDGDLKAVRFNIRYGDGLELQVDWDNVTHIGGDDIATTEIISNLLSSVRNAVAIWFNVSKTETCFNITPAINVASMKRAKNDRCEDPNIMCREKIEQEGSWNSLCCNEDMNIVVTNARGLGRDMFWPPTHPRGTHTYSDIIPNDLYDYCKDPCGVYGYPNTHDSWSKWLDIYYGGQRILSESNIVFSNGLLDPWSAAGVYTSQVGIHYITDSMLSIVMEYGGHHTDLMYSHPDDPTCVREARKVEEIQIRKWIHDWDTQMDAPLQKIW